MSTVAERQWMDAVAQLGCIACRVMGRIGTPCAIHHILDGGRRIGHLDTIGLCYLHHNSGRLDDEIVCRHPWHREFEKRYGTEQELLEMTRRLVLTLDGRKVRDVGTSSKREWWEDRPEFDDMTWIAFGRKV